MDSNIESLNSEAIKNLTALDNPLKDTETVGHGSFSTFLRNFQFLNLVSVSVNVSTNHEDEWAPSKTKRSEKQITDHHRDIFGEPNDVTSEETLVNEFEAQVPNRTNLTSTSATKIPLLFYIMSSDCHELFPASTDSSYDEIFVSISDLVASSPNCEERNSRHEKMGVPKIIEINVKWGIGDGEYWPKKTKLTKENCEAVMLMLKRMKRTKMNVLEVELQ